MRRLALTCDTTNCMAFLLLRKPEEADEFHRAAEEKWDDTAAEIRCPVCIRGAGPMLERGDCEACGGRLATRHGVELCRDCHTPTRDNGPEWTDDGEDQDDEDVMPTGPGEWAGAGGEEDQDDDTTEAGR